MNIEEDQDRGSLQWFAVRVKSNCERAIVNMAISRGVEPFVPLYRCRKRWSDRVKWVELPLFPGYVFCRIDQNVRLPVLTIPGVMHFVGIGRVPVPIEDSEIAAIRSAVLSGLPTEPWAYLNAGQLVRFDGGPLAGLEGILVESRKPCRVVVSVTLLRRSVAVEIERDWATPLGADRRPLALRWAAQTA